MMALNLYFHALVYIALASPSSVLSVDSLMQSSLRRPSRFAADDGAGSRAAFIFAARRSARLDSGGFCSCAGQRAPQFFRSRRPSLSQSTGLHVGSHSADADRGDLLTPETYADARSAEHQVEDVITARASDAFRSTDFAHTPHLSPELEDAETCYQAALLAKAAHEFAEMAEKENKQSRAAMLEREREMEWIEKRDDAALNEADSLMEEIQAIANSSNST